MDFALCYICENKFVYEKHPVHIYFVYLRQILCILNQILSFEKT